MIPFPWIIIWPSTEGPKLRLLWKKYSWIYYLKGCRQLLIQKRELIHHEAHEMTTIASQRKAFTSAEYFVSFVNISENNCSGFNVMPWASYQIRKIARCACARNAGNVFPATDFKGNRGLAIPACITARAPRTCRDACRDSLPAVAGKTARHFRRMRNPQLYVSGKRPITIPFLE